MKLFCKSRFGGVVLVVLGTYFLLTTLGVLFWDIIGQPGYVENVFHAFFVSPGWWFEDA
ncbi:MAG TPA: hypothetical protein VMW83_11920 [Spirochaetia bacterium]|nr:hypothetical protein [Spirochaetia bacterium]